MPELSEAEFQREAQEIFRFDPSDEDEDED